jgi:hypothetical protein
VLCVVGFVADAGCFGYRGDGNKILSLGSILSFLYVMRFWFCR